MEMNEIDDRIDTVLREITIIKSQIEGAKYGAKTKGEYADTDWFHRANKSLRFKGIEHQKLLIERKKIKDKIKQNRNKNLDQCFVEVSKITLSHELYMKILDTAIILHSSTNQDEY